MAKKQKNVKNGTTSSNQSSQTTYAAALANNKAEKKGKKGLTDYVLPAATIVIALFVAAYFLLSQESEVLFKSQEMNLWIADDTFYDMYKIYPGGWLSWAGSYMTEFFYHPALGVTLLMLAWAAIMAILSFMYKLKGWKILLTALIPLMLLTAVTQTGYWVYLQKLHGHMWVPTLGIGISALAACICHSIARRMPAIPAIATRVVLSATFAWFGYKLLGMWSFAGVMMMALPTSLTSSKQTEGSSKSSIVSTLLPFLPAVFAVAFIYFVPRLAYDTIFEQTIKGEIYHAGMPTFRYGYANLHIYRLAYYLLAASFLPIMIAAWVPQTFWKKNLGKVAALVMLVVTFGYGTRTLLDRWNHDQNYHIEIAMGNAVDRQDWQGVLDALTQGIKVDSIRPTRAMVMMKNLALYRQGRIGNEMFNYPEGSRQQNIDEYYKYGDAMYPEQVFKIADPDTMAIEKNRFMWNIRLSQIAGKKMYYNYGKLNFCYRWCMEDAVEFGWRVEDIKMMAQCAMLKGEDVVARKYLNILKQTRYHREWAEKQEKFIGNFEAMRDDPELKPITYLMQYGNRLDGDNTLIEMYLLQTFAHGNGADPYYQEMTLISAMLMKDIQLFWPRFFRYAEMHKSEPNFHMPRHYQEAAYLYGHLENEVDISNLPFDQSVKQSYESFMNYNARVNNRIITQVTKEFDSQMKAARTEEERAKVAKKIDDEFNVRMREEFRPLYGNTFYFFYYLMRNQKTN